MISKMPVMSPRSLSEVLLFALLANFFGGALPVDLLDVRANGANNVEWLGITKTGDTGELSVD